MPNKSGLAFTEFPPFEPHTDQTVDDKHDSPFEFTFEDHFEDIHNNSKNEMAGAGSPYIKTEPNDFFNFNSFSNNNQNNNNFGMNSFNNQNNHNVPGSGVDPSQLGHVGSMPQNFGQNMSSSFVMGNSGIADDELADLAGSLDNGHNPNAFHNNQHNTGMDQQQMFYNNNSNNNTNNNNNMIQQQNQHNMHSIYSSTPEGAPIQSPFVNHDGFNYGQFRPTSSQMVGSAGYQNSLIRAQHLHNLERKISESRSPASPNTPGLNDLQLGDPQFPNQSMQQTIMNHNHRHSAGGLSNNWDSTPSAQSWGEASPFGSSPGHSLHHAQISEVLRAEQGKMGPSIVTKMEPGTQTNDAKKRRRRESHNLVERRRRDNINERIHDLANLVPQHRLEDEKVRKHLQTNSPLSPSITATSMSPPPPSSLLATSAGRRATGSITQGLPIEDKDKGPNKGDILNSSVAWARDIMWYMKLKMEQEAELETLIRNLGGVWPFEQSEDERRMRSEMLEVIERNVRSNNVQPYSRATGSGLRVPGYTNIAGDPLNQGEGGQSGYSSGQGTSPGMQSGGSGGAHNQNWHSTSVFKEEDEFDADML